MGVSGWISFLAIGAVIALKGTDGAATDAPVAIGSGDLLNLMREANSGSTFVGTRQPDNVYPTKARNDMQNFLRSRMSRIVALVGGKAGNHYLEEQDFATTIGNSQAACVNYIAVLSRNVNETADDEPLVIVANYDTDTNTGGTVNPVEDNGSGLAAMLVVAEFIAKEIQAEKYKLRHSIVFVAADASIYKYKSQPSSPQTAQSGAQYFVKNWLPKYMQDRKRLRGAIVLDNILNFQGAEATQTNGGTDKAYPEAYGKMSEGKFAGDFLALVARDDDLDRPLVQAFEEGWEGSMKQKREQGGNTPNRTNVARLITFAHNKANSNGDIHLRFLESDQHAFWSQDSQVAEPYPAVLLTDTRMYRTPICSVSNNCNFLDASTSLKNLAFAHRTILALHSTIVSLQSSSTVNMGGMVTVISLLVLALRNYAF